MEAIQIHGFDTLPDPSKAFVAYHVAEGDTEYATELAKYLLNPQTTIGEISPLGFELRTLSGAEAGTRLFPIPEIAEAVSEAVDTYADSLRKSKAVVFVMLHDFPQGRLLELLIVTPNVSKRISNQAELMIERIRENVSQEMLSNTDVNVASLKSLRSLGWSLYRGSGGEDVVDRLHIAAGPLQAAFSGFVFFEGQSADDLRDELIGIFGDYPVYAATVLNRLKRQRVGIQL